MKRFATFVARSTSLLGAFVAAAVVIGLIGAGLVAPVVGALGTAARGGVGMFDRLPGDLEQNPVAQQSEILAADGSLLSTPAQENRIIVPLEEISPHMRDAQIAIEDERFYEHGGMDAQGTLRAFVTNQVSDDVQGGSTLTQQYVKLILQEQARNDDDTEAQVALSARSGLEGYTRKLRELKYAVTLEERLSKDEILEGYLNLVYYGDQVYGVESAANHYFNVSAADLTIAQSATLAGVVRAPGITDPVSNIEAATERRNLVLDNMLGLDMITEAEHTQATESEITLDVTPSQQSCQSSSHPYFCDYATEWLLQQDALGDTREERLNRLTTGGLTVETTLDTELGTAIDQLTRDYVPAGNEYELDSAAAVVEPGTGHVLAIGQNTTYDVAEDEDPTTTSLNYSVDQAYGGSTGFAIGSIAKAYTLVTAVEQGMPLDTTLRIPQEQEWDDENQALVADLDNPSDDTSPVVIYEPADFQSGCTLGDTWAVHNAEGANFDTSMTLRRATASSVNSAFAQLASEVGTCDIRDTINRMKLTTGAGGEYGTFPPDFVLGSQPSTPITVASSYAALAAGGTYCPPTPVLRILDSNGEEIPLQEVECEQVVDPDVAAGVVELMQEVVSIDGSGFRAELADNRPAAGKTGTNDPSTSTWFAGFTPELSTAVWIGKATDPNQPVQPMRDLQLGDRQVEGWLYGSKLAAPLWKDVMDFALADAPVTQFETPSSRLTQGENAEVPEVRGLTRDEAEDALAEAGYSMDIHPYTYRSQLPDGAVVQTDPREGATERTGSTITVYLSGDGSSYDGPGVADEDDEDD